MNRLLSGLILSSLILFIGCAKPHMYYWGNYSDSLYQSKKYPSEESVLKHKQVLENIIEESKKDNLRVPPGVYAELGYIYFRQNNNQLALQYFELEKATYPEAVHFMNRLENAIKLQDKPKTSADNIEKRLSQDKLE